MSRYWTLPVENPNPVVRNPQNIGTIYAHSIAHGSLQTRGLKDRPGSNRQPEMDQIPGTTNEKLISRVRQYVWREGYYINPGDTPGNHNWTNDGPIRDMPTTRFNKNYYPNRGGTHQWGMHTYMATGQVGGNQLAGKSKMRQTGQNRLTVQRYRGQSYSASTQVVN